MPREPLPPPPTLAQLREHQVLALAQLPSMEMLAQGADGLGTRDYPLGRGRFKRRAPPRCPLLEVRRQGRNVADTQLGRLGEWAGAVPDAVTL